MRCLARQHAMRGRPVLAPGARFIHESVLAQRSAHPFRTSGQELPWGAAPDLRAECAAMLWQVG
jgi:hypothetical protein